jgi:hypothetical protein
MRSERGIEIGVDEENKCKSGSQNEARAGQTPEKGLSMREKRDQPVGKKSENLETGASAGSGKEIGLPRQQNVRESVVTQGS